MSKIENIDKKEKDLKKKINNIKIFADYNPELIKFLRNKNIKFEAWKIIL